MTIRDLQGREDLDLISVDLEVHELCKMFGLGDNLYDGFLVKADNGEIVEAYGFSGYVPFLNKTVKRII